MLSSFQVIVEVYKYLLELMQTFLCLVEYIALLIRLKLNVGSR